MPRSASDTMRCECPPERRCVCRVARARLVQPDAVRHGLPNMATGRDMRQRGTAQRGTALREARKDWHGTAQPRTARHSGR
jgi:hypothetical protein